MSQILKTKLIKLLIIVAISGGILIKNLSILKPQYSNTKENYIKDVAADFQNIQNSDNDKELNSLFDKEDLSDNSKYKNNNTKKKETSDSNLKRLNSNNTTNEQTSNTSKLKDVNSDVIKNQVSTDAQTTTSSQLKIANNNATKSNTTSTNVQTTTSSQSQDTNSNVNTEKQTNTNTTLETKIPTIHYDRTTSIYTDDYNTLLRIEYYVNNKLTYYSEIEKYDDTTKSYVEKIYQCNRETNIDPLIRTDVYINGILTKSY